MKRKIFSLFVALMATVVVQAQQIAVVAEDGTTNMYRTLQEAIEGASGGSVVYLPGGGFTIADSVKITKKLTIIGIGHKAQNENADGNTTILGNLWFNEGSDGSAVMGCYISGRIKIGEVGIVNYVTVKQCFINGIDVLNSGCVGTFVNQNYVVDRLLMGNSDCVVKNNIIRWTNVGYGPCINDVGSGIIQHNILLYGSISITNVNATVKDNVVTAWDGLCNKGNLVTSGNMGTKEMGDYAIVINAGWNDVFVDYNNGKVSTSSNFHFKEAYQQYESLCGIYAGTGFDDSQLPPVPYISSKSIPGETDASGKLHIQITVNAN